MKQLLFLSLTIILPLVLVAQRLTVTDTTKSTYGNLPTFKVYAVSSSSMISADTSWFKLNDKEVDENTYRKYTQYLGNIDKCKPCILLSYDTSEHLLVKNITYGDCRVGYWIEYYPNGKPRVVGHYKENASGNWENIFARGYCREDGVWTYYSKNGIIKFFEIWKDGKMIKRLRSKTK